MRKNVSDFIRGEICAEIFGAYPESFLNCAAARGTELWDGVNVNDNTIRFFAYEDSAEELKECARICSCELKIISRTGGSRILRFALRRKWLFASALLFASLFALSSLFIWRIDVYGNERTDRLTVLRTLEDCGIEVGRFWPSISSDEVRNAMLQRLPELAWMSVNVNGSRAEVLIKERLPKPVIYKQAQARDLVSSKDAIVRRVSVLSGSAAVKPGQAVRRGELLVSGTLTRLDGKARSVCSRGSVMAETWTEINAVCPSKTQSKEYTGAEKKRYALVLGKKRINLYISSGKTIDECDKIIKEQTLGTEGLFLTPLKLICETMPYYKSVSVGETDTAAMKDNLHTLLTDRCEGQILSSGCTDAVSGELIIVTLRAHCIENIAVPAESGVPE